MTTSTLLPTRRVLPARAIHPLHALGMALGMIVLWALWAVYFNTAQFGDNIEQFNWSQSLELGYHKHPPLPSWVLGTTIKLFGKSVYWAYALATLCLLGTAMFTWLIGRDLVGARISSAAIVLWGLNMTFSQRVQLYNHNTVLVLCLAACVWFAMRAGRGPRGGTAWWLATGVAAGAATLSKYQALVPLAGLVFALALAGRLRAPAQWRGLALAIVVMIGVCTPHAIWVAQHDFSTLRYASESIEAGGLRQRLGFVVAFLANQIRLWSPALLAIALCALWSRLAPRAPAAAVEAPPARDLRAWMIGLLWAGLGVLLLMALGAGSALRNHWGVQGLQFFAIWLAVVWDHRSPIDLRRLVFVALAVHAASLGWYAAEHRDPTTLLTGRRIDTMYPARRLARAAVQHWRETTDCPLRYVAGTVFDAGLVSLYSGGRLEVFDTESATPWVRPEELRRRGALYVIDDNDPVPPGVTHVAMFDLVPLHHPTHAPKTVRLGVMLPEQPCH